MIIDKVRKAIFQKLRENKFEPCSDDDLIISNGMMSSTDILEILLDLESEGLNVTHVPLEKVDSINDIVKYVK